MKIKELFEAKPKGVTDKNFGKAAKPSKSGFIVGQRVAWYVGSGQTKHGDVVNPDASSNGTKGVTVRVGPGLNGLVFVPLKDIKDAEQYWKDEDVAMRKEREKK